MFTPEEKQKVREATDLVALVAETVALRPRGRDLWGCCPFHHEKSPSFHVMPDRGFWKCFSCGKGGDCFDYVMERDHLEFPEAVHYLADRAGITLSDDGTYERRAPGSAKKARLFEVMDAAVAHYHAQLTRVRSEGADAARAYLAGRGFGLPVADRWDLGYAPGYGSLVRHLTEKGFTANEMVEANLAVRRNGTLADRFYNRVIFPIRDERGRAVALGGRVLDDSKPKYLNSSETPIFHKGSTLFALDGAKAHITAQMEAVVMEGYTDVIASHEAGIKNAVAPLGTAFRARHVKTLARFLTAAGERVSRGRIVCLFDGDEAGLKAAERALQYVGLTTAGMYCTVLPGGMDPAEFLAAEGADALRARIADPQPLVRFVIDRHLDRFDAATPEQRSLALSDTVQAMAPIKGTPLAEEYVEYVAGRLLCDPSTVRAALVQVRWIPPRDDEDDETADGGPAVYGGGAQGSQGTLALNGGGTPAARGEAAGRGGEPAGRGQAQQPVRLLPDDARMMRVEREVLSTMAADVEAARPFAERVAGLTWADPSHEAIAWAILAAPEGCGVQDVLTAAESACPQAAQVLADGTVALDEEAPAGRALEILLDDLEIRGLRRHIDRGRALLRSAEAVGTQEYDALFAELTEQQRRLTELEAKVRRVQ